MHFFFGILLGLTAATGFSFAYLGSRFFYEKAEKSPFLLLAVSQIQMGIFAAILLPFVWSPFPLSPATLFPLMGTVLFGMGGQLIFFFTLQHSTPSQVIPLLALKIFILAFVSILVLQKAISPLQWGGIVLCFTATFLSSFTGDSIPFTGFLGILATCTGYTMGDVFVTMLIRELTSLNAKHPVLLATCLIYGTAGIAGLFLGLPQRRTLKTVIPWKFALYFSIFFFLADFCLFTTFKLVGPIFGNIVQSTRGLFSILLAKLISRRGMTYLEPEMGRAVVIQRIVAASLFTLAIALYVLGE